MAKDTKRHRGRVGRPPLKSAGEIDARILLAATAMFLERGYEATAYEGVAASAGVSKATIYGRHPTKPDLFAAMIRSNVVAAMVSATEVPSDGPVRERLRRAGRAIIVDAMRPVPLALMRLFISEASRHGDLIREVDRAGRDAAVATLAAAIVGDGKNDLHTAERSRSAASRFIDLAFVPHQMRALLGDPPEDLNAGLDARIEDAIQALEASGSLEM